MANVIAVLIIVAVLGLAIGYIVHAKRRGEVCIGCPHAKQCASKEHSCQCGDSKE